MNQKPKANPIALLPILVFLVLYLGLGIVYEYVLKIEMGFYQIPIVVAFLAAVLVACLQNRSTSFDEKLELMAQGVGDKNIMTMILIFLAAGCFVGVTGRSSAEAVAYFLLSVTPPRMAMLVMFVVSCFVSTAMGTSVGTITLLTPIAVEVAQATGYGVVMPTAGEMTLEKPQMLRKNGSFGVKLKAGAPSIHMIRVDIDTEISPMVGGEQQSQDLIQYLSSEDPDKLWESNIFGKSVYELIREGLTAKLVGLPEDVRGKFRGSLTRIVNEGATGLICLIL